MDSVANIMERELQIFESTLPDTLYRYLFSKEYTITELSIKIYPHLYDEKFRKSNTNKALREAFNKREIEKPFKKKKPHAGISKYVNAFDKLGWLISRVDPQDKRKTYYRATLKPYFQYRKEFFQDDFNEKQKKIIEDLFKNLNGFVSAKNGFLEYIDNVVERMLFNFFFLLPNNVKDSQFKEYADLTLKYYDDFTLKLFKEMILNKAHEAEIFKIKLSREDKNKIENFLDKINDKIKSEK